MKLKLIFIVAILFGGMFGRATAQTRDGMVYTNVDGNYTSHAGTPLAAAMEYLKRSGDELKIDPGLLRSNLPPATNLIASVGEEYRLWINRFHQNNGLTQIIFKQTYFGLPTYDGYIEVGIEPADNGSWQVLYATKRLHAESAPEKPSKNSIDRLQNSDAKTLARVLGLSGAGHSKTNRADQSPKGIRSPATVKIYAREWMIYRYDAGGRVRITSVSFAPMPPPDIPPLPAVDKRIQNHHQYVVMRVNFGGVIAYIEPDTLSVLYYVF